MVFFDARISRQDVILREEVLMPDTGSRKPAVVSATVQHIRNSEAPTNRYAIVFK
jgi:hypothetical protein